MCLLLCLRSCVYLRGRKQEDMEDTTTPKRRAPRRQAADTTPRLSDYGHVQPQALEFEEAVLGALMIDSDAIGRLGGMLKPESFYDKRNQLLFEAIQQMDLNDRPVDILTVTEFLRSKGTLDEVGGPVYVAQLTSKVVSSVNIEYHANIIAQKKLARDLIRFTSKTQTQAFDETQDIDELMQQAESELFEISGSKMKKDYTQINPVIKQAYDQIITASKNTSGISGLSTGYHRLDKVLSGWQPTDLIILAARPAMGKTAFVLTMARNMAIDYEAPVAFFSLEMSSTQLMTRLIVGETGLSGNLIRSGKLSPSEWKTLETNTKALGMAPLFIDDTPALSIFEFRSKVRRLKANNGIKIIMVDYLQLMTAAGHGDKGNREQEVAFISRSLKGIAKELNVPIIALSQLSRATESRGGSKRPQLSDLRESGAIEQDADLVAFIHRPEYYGFTAGPGEEPVEGLAEFIIAKHRNGSVEDVRLRFIKEQAKFTNWDQINTGMGQQYEEFASAPFEPMESSSSVLQNATSTEFAPF